MYVLVDVAVGPVFVIQIKPLWTPVEQPFCMYAFLFLLDYYMREFLDSAVNVYSEMTELCCSHCVTLQ